MSTDSTQATAGANLHLHSPLEMGGMSLSHRVVMAPLTRMRATVPGNTANASMARYFRHAAPPG